MFALIIVELKVFDSFEDFDIEFFFYEFSFDHRIGFELFVVDDDAVDLIDFCDFSLILFLFLLLCLFGLLNFIEHDAYSEVAFPKDALEQIS